MGIVIVLVRTHSPGNLGSAARAAKNFEASLALFDPKTEGSHPDALAFSSGATDVLSAAPVVSTWDQVRHFADRLVALSSLRGRAPRGLPPATSWPKIRREALDRRVALVFGPERGGLLATDLFACDARISLPSSPSFPTLNLSQAVAATLALCRVKREARTPRSQDTAPSRDLALLLERLHSVLAKASYPGAGHSRAVLSEIDSFIRRGHPTVREVRLWLGALSALERKLEGQEKAGD